MFKRIFKNFRKCSLFVNGRVNLLLSGSLIRIFSGIVVCIALFTFYPGNYSLTANYSHIVHRSDKKKYPSLSDIVPFKNKGPGFIHPFTVICKNIENGKYNNYPVGKEISVRKLSQDKRLRVYPIKGDYKDAVKNFGKSENQLEDTDKCLGDFCSRIKSGNVISLYYKKLSSNDKLIIPDYSKGTNRKFYEAATSELLETGIMPWASNPGVFSYLSTNSELLEVMNRKKMETTIVLGDGNCRYLPLMLSVSDSVIMVDEDINYVKWIHFLTDFLAVTYPDLAYDRRTLVVQSKPDSISIPSVADLCLWHFDSNGKSEWPLGVKNESQFYRWLDSYLESVRISLKEPEEDKDGGFLLAMEGFDGRSRYTPCQVIRHFDRCYPNMVLNEKQIKEFDDRAISLLYKRPGHKKEKYLRTPKGRAEYEKLLNRELKRYQALNKRILVMKAQKAKETIGKSAVKTIDFTKRNRCFN